MARALTARNPRTGVHDFSFHALDPPEVAQTAQALRAAQPAWEALGLQGRAEALLGFADALGRLGEPISAALELDTGRRRLARLELEGVRASLGGWAAFAQQQTPPDWVAGRSHAHLRHKPQFRPYTLVGVISPWNFPLTLALIDAVPALLAGAAVLIKPSEVTPRFIAPLQAALDAAGLGALCRLCPGDAITGAAVLETADAVCFTGSLATGRKIAEAAARRLIPAFLELGGKDPLIILASADLDRAVDAALRGATLATGQACQSIERIYVARSVLPPFLERLVERAQGLRLNWPDIAQGEIGPIIFDKQAELLAEHLADAVAKGARVLTGGAIERHGGGCWLRPTVLADVTHEMRVMREETFGPILPVMAFDRVEEAVALANDSPYGLSAAVIAGDVAEAETVALQIDAGAISLNDAALTALFHEAPKHAFKGSGLGGSRMGPQGFERFLRRKAMIANDQAPTPIEAFAEEA